MFWSLLRRIFQIVAATTSGCGCGASVLGAFLGVVLMLGGALLFQGSQAIGTPAPSGHPVLDGVLGAGAVVLTVGLALTGVVAGGAGALLAALAGGAVVLSLFGALAALVAGGGDQASA